MTELVSGQAGDLSETLAQSKKNKIKNKKTDEDVALG